MTAHASCRFIPRLLAAAGLLALAGLAGCMAPPGGGGFGCAPSARPLTARDVEEMTGDLERLVAMAPGAARTEAEEFAKKAADAAGKTRSKNDEEPEETADAGRLYFLAGFAFERAGAFRDAEANYEAAARGSFGAAAALRRGEVLRLQLNQAKQAGKAYDMATGMVVREAGAARGWLVASGQDTTYKAESALASDTGARLITVNLEMAALYRIDDLRKEGPLYRFIDVVVHLLGANPKFSYALALIVVALVVTIITTPLTNASFKSMRAMQRLQPLLKELQEKHRDDRQALAAEQMRLMKKHKVNPLGGCLPMLIQMPILIAVYYGIRDYRYQFAGASLDGLIKNLAHPNMVLLVLYAVSMYLSQKLTTLPTADPQQQQMQRMMTLMMPVMFMVLFQGLPSAFILYWLSYNVFFTARQYYMIKRPEPPAAEPAQPEGEPRRPTPGGRRRKKRR